MRDVDAARSAAARARLMAHAFGLACYEGLAVSGTAGDLAWVAGVQLLAALALVEAGFGLLSLGDRRPFVPASLVWRGALRSLAAWSAGILLLKAGLGLSWAGAL